MPTITLPARLLQATVDISAGQWFVVYPNDTVSLIPAEEAAVLHDAPKGNKLLPEGLTPGLFLSLQYLAKQSKPVPAGKRNASGQLSRLKALGFAINDGGKWSITETGRTAIK